MSESVCLSAYDLKCVTTWLMNVYVCMYAHTRQSVSESRIVSTTTWLANVYVCMYAQSVSESRIVFITEPMKEAGGKAGARVHGSLSMCWWSVDLSLRHSLRSW